MLLYVIGVSSLSNGPNWAGGSPPHLRTETDQVSETLCSLVFFWGGGLRKDGQSPNPSNSDYI
jgi:hypothetical protein